MPFVSNPSTVTMIRLPRPYSLSLKMTRVVPFTDMDSL